MTIKGIIGCLFLSLFSLGIYDVLKNFETNNCAMTYMFETPEYMKIELDTTVAARFPQYGLYLYREGQHAYNARTSGFQLNGIPVLFIPGNAGSYRQVRSLGSVALRMAESLRTEFHFDFFALDLDEELSGIYGPLLSDQTEFAHLCIKQILNLYSGVTKFKPKSVFLVGHSMGGLVARALYTLPKFDPSLVNGILTQATPHQMPVIAIDSVLSDFYRRVNKYWEDNPENTLNNVLVISTGGGHRDILVRNGLTSLNKIVDPECQVSASTMSIPKAWVSTDHLAHVWCKQVVMASVRAMFDCVDHRTKQMSDDHQTCRRAFLYHYQSNSGAKFFEASANDTDGLISLDEGVIWATSKERLLNFEAKQVATGFYHVLEISEVASTDSAFVSLTNMDEKSWIGGCSLQLNESRCKEIERFDHEAHVIPPNGFKFKAIHLDGNKLSRFTHLVVRVPKSKLPVKLMVDMYKVAVHHVVLDIPRFSHLLWKAITKFDSRTEIFNRTLENDVFYNITLKGLESPLQAYTVHVSVLKCSDRSSVVGVPTTTVAKLHIPWSHEHTYASFPHGHSGQFSIKLQSGQPADYDDSAQLHLYLEPSCTYEVNIRLSLLELCGQFVRFYGILVPTFLTMQVLMALTWQLKRLRSEGVAPSFFEAHSSWAQPYRVVPVATAFQFVISKFRVSTFANTLGIPVDDIEILKEQDIWHPFLPILLYLFTYSFMALYGKLATAAVAGLSKLGSICFGWCCSSSFIQDLFSMTSYILLIVGAYVAFSMCGTLGLISAYLVHLMKAFVCATLARRAPSKEIWNVYNMSFTLATLMNMMVVLNAVPFIVWFKGLERGDLNLLVDPSRNIGIIACLTSIPLLSSDYRLGANLVTTSLITASYLSVISMLVYATVSVYRTSYFVSAILSLLALSVMSAVRH